MYLYIYIHTWRKKSPLWREKRPLNLVSLLCGTDQFEVRWIFMTTIINVCGHFNLVRLRLSKYCTRKSWYRWQRPNYAVWTSDICVIIMIIQYQIENAVVFFGLFFFFLCIQPNILIQCKWTNETKLYMYIKQCISNTNTVSLRCEKRRCAHIESVFVCIKLISFVSFIRLYFDVGSRESYINWANNKYFLNEWEIHIVLVVVYNSFTNISAVQRLPVDNHSVVV